MSSQKYLATFVGALVGIMVLALGVATIDDPFGMLPLHHGDHTIRWWRNGNDRLIKAYDPVLRPAGVIFLGSSRIKQGFDPDSIREFAHGPVYNAGLDNGVLVDSARLANFYAAHVRGLRRMCIEIFVVKTLIPSDPVIELILPWDIAKDFSKMLLSGSALAAALETRYMSTIASRGASMPPFTLPNGYYPVPAHPAPNTTFDAWTDGQWRLMRLRLHRSDRLVRYLRLIRERAAAHGITVSYFISPLHSWVLYGYERNHDWAVLEQLKRDLASVGGVYDFMRYNEIQDEPPAPHMRYWFEVWHFKPETGRLMAGAMLDRARVEIPSNFGVLLNPTTIEGDIASFRLERDVWVARNRAVVERFHDEIR